MEKLSVRGYSEALRSYFEISGIRRRLAKTMLEERPDLFIGVDSSDFNLGLERRLKEGRHPDHPLRQPVGLGLAPLAHAAHRARRRPHPGDAAVRGAAVPARRASR